VLLVLALVCLATAVFIVFQLATAPARERLTSVRRAATYGREHHAALSRERFRTRALLPLKEKLAHTVLRLSPKITLEAVGLKLLAAGAGRTVSATEFLAAKGSLAVAGLLLGGLLGAAASGTLGGFVLAGALGALGFLMPEFWISARARSRRERVRADLPDALDLLAVSVEAGLGFDGAISKLTEHMEGPLAEEFALTLGEMRFGESRQEALKKLSERVSANEVAAFSRAIIQADQLGISLGRILRVQAADTRLRRQAAAEERAMKAPIKMLFPTVLFIFPAMFLVILGPAFLNLSKLF
jgi:tight adherence protein C